MRKSYTKSTFLIIFLLTIQFSPAQIVYTDIEDAEVNCRSSNCQKTYQLDINNDGIYEVTISANTDRGGNSLGCKAYLMGVTVSSHSGNAIVFSDESVFALPAGSSINSATQYWVDNPQHSLRSVWAGNAWGACLELWSGNWITGNDYFMGLRFTLNGQTYFGWVRLSVVVSKTKSSFIVKDYAYQSTAGAGVISGDKGSSIATKLPNDEEKTETILSGDLKIFPNPVSSTSITSFSLSKPGKGSIAVYDVSGRLVKKIADREFSEGTHQVSLNAKDLVSGIYILRFQSAGILQTKKFFVIK